MPSTTDKSASFLSGVTSGVGSVVRRGAEAVVRPVVHARQNIRLARSQASLDRARASLNELLKQRGLGRSGRPVPTAVPTVKPGPVDFGKTPHTKPTTKKPLISPLGKGLLLVGGGAALYGAGKAATTRIQQPLAPPEHIPMGY